MSDAQITDLKQFILAVVGQAEARIKRELSEELDRQLDRKLDLKIGRAVNELRQEMRDGFGGIAAIFEAHNEQLDDHEGRLGRLEAGAA